MSRTALIDTAVGATQAGLEALAGILPAESHVALAATEPPLRCRAAVPSLSAGCRSRRDGRCHPRRCARAPARGDRDPPVPGDSYWAPDYDSRLSEADRTRDYSEDIESRNRLLERPGDEAQWCIFDLLIIRPSMAGASWPRERRRIWRRKCSISTGLSRRSLRTGVARSSISNSAAVGRESARAAPVGAGQRCISH